MRIGTNRRARSKGIPEGADGRRLSGRAGKENGLRAIAARWDEPDGEVQDPPLIWLWR